MEEQKARIGQVSTYQAAGRLDTSMSRMEAQDTRLLQELTWKTTSQQERLDGNLMARTGCKITRL
jgi:hypothetical protein